LAKYNDKFAITFDIWSSQNKTSFLGATLHYFFDNKLQKELAGIAHLRERHTGAYIATKIHSILARIGKTTEDVSFAVTDNGSNMLTTCTTLQVQRIACAAHTLQLCVNHVIWPENPTGGSPQQEISQLLAKVRRIVSAVRSSSQARVEFEAVVLALGEDVRFCTSPLPIVLVTN